MQETSTTKTNRQLISDILAEVHPHLDTADDEVLFGQIIDDYERYAAMIESRESDIAEAEARGELRGRNAAIAESEAEEPESDGVPDLGGANTTYAPRTASIFDIARGM